MFFSQNSSIDLFYMVLCGIVHIFLSMIESKIL